MIASSKHVDVIADRVSVHDHDLDPVQVVDDEPRLRDRAP
jgi:hypothetical protein